MEEAGSEDVFKTEGLGLSGLGAGAKKTAVLQGGGQGDQEVVIDNEPIRKYTEDSGRSLTVSQGNYKEVRARSKSCDAGEEVQT